MRRGFTRKYEPVRVLSDSQVETIHKLTLEVLSEVGSKFESQSAYQTLIPAMSSVFLRCMKITR